MIERTLSLLPLSKAPMGSHGCVKTLCGDSQTNRRLRELGFYEGASIILKSRMPFGGPLVVEVDQFALALRKSEAEFILVEVQ